VKTTDLRADLLAGATVALVGLPQCLAYATMSGLPPAYGLTTAIVPGVVAAAAGRSRFVITGPTNTTGLLVLGALLPFLGANGLLQPAGLGWLASLTLLCGLLRILFAAGGGAALVRFIPESVLAGFAIGVGILIAVMQVDEALGLPPVAAAGLWSEYRGVTQLLAGGAAPSAVAAAVTLLCIGIVAVGPRVWRSFPGALFAVASAAFAAWALGLDASAGLPLVRDRSAATAGWPPGAMPDLRLEVIGTLLLPSAAIVLLGTLELLVTARADESRPRVGREIMAQGIANVAGAFASAFPASASLTRSALLRFSEPRSRAAAAFAALLSLPVLLFGSTVIAYIPQAALAGVLFITAAAMVRPRTLGRLWRASAVGRLLLAVTTVSTLVLPLWWAVFIGAGLGLVIHLARTSSPRVRRLTVKNERLSAEPQDAPGVVVLEVSGAVHYAAVEPLLAELERQLPSSARLVIVDLTHAHELRFTGLRALEWWAADLERRGIQLRLAGVTEDVRDLLQAANSHLAYTMWDAEPGRSALNSFRASGGS
jgi:SulP family sulfate permease